MKERMVILRTLSKRLLFQKSFWLCICLIPLLSILVSGMEQSADTLIYGAVYADSPEVWQEVFEKEEGVFRFYFCDTEDRLKRDVVSGKAECGYVLTEDLQKKFAEDDWYWAVTVYQSPDTMLAELMNETVFSNIFHIISTEWYEGYIANHRNFAEAGLPELRVQIRQALEEELNSGGTFHITTEYMLSEKEPLREEGQGTGRIFPVRGMMAAGIFLCGLLGAMEILQDRKKRYFFKKPPFFTMAATAGLPVSFGVAAGFLTLLATGNVQDVWQEAGCLLLYTVLVTVYGMALAAVIRRERVLAGLIPALVLANLICTPVLLDLAGIFPIMRLAEKFFPAAYYLRGLS